MYLRYEKDSPANQHGDGLETGARNIQHGQRKRKRTPLGLNPREPQDTPVSNEPMTVQPVTVQDATTTYINPGFVVYQQWTTVTEGGSVVVKSQITVSNVVPTGNPETGSGPVGNAPSNVIFTGGLLTDSTQPTSSSSVTRSVTQARTAEATATPSQSSAPPAEPSNAFNPVVIFVLCLVLVLGGAFLITSIFLYRRSKKRKAQEEEDRKSAAGKEKAILLRPGSAGSQRSQRPESPLPPPPISPIAGRSTSMLTRKQSELLPSPMVAFPRNAYPKFMQASDRGTVSDPGRSTPYPASSVFDRDAVSEYGGQTVARTTSSGSDERGRKASSVFGLHFDQSYALSGTGSYLQVVESTDGARTPRPSLDTVRGDPSSPSGSSGRSQQSRHKSFVSMESAIDPDLAYTSNGFRISTQFDDAASMKTSTTHPYSPTLSRKPQGDKFGNWNDYDLSRTMTGNSSKRSEYDGQSMMSPKLSPLGENSVWEDALVDVDLDRPPVPPLKTGTTGERKWPMI